MSISKKDLVQRVAQRCDLAVGEARCDRNSKEIEEIIDITLDEIYQSLKQRESVNLRNFGTFYIKAHRDSCAFKFNPSQKLRKLFGWSSTYKGKI